MGTDTSNWPYGIFTKTHEDVQIKKAGLSCLFYLLIHANMLKCNK